jgi:hypothetical protein
MNEQKTYLAPPYSALMHAVHTEIWRGELLPPHARAHGQPELLVVAGYLLHVATTESKEERLC